MRVLRLADVPCTERDRVFRASPGRALAGSLFAVLAGIALAWLSWRSRFWLPAWLTGLTFLFLLLFRRLVTARFRPSNWLVRVADQGVYVQFRSHLNWHFPPDDLTVAFLPFGEIRAARLVRQRRTVPDWGTGSGGLESASEQRRRLVELDLSGDTTELAAALTAELARKGPPMKHWWGSARTRWGHSPVRLASDSTLQIEWRVRPGYRTFLAALAPYATIGAPRREQEDLTTLERAGQRAQEQRLIELVETGETMAAVKIARRLYDMDLAQATAFVDGLRGRTPSA